MLCELMKNFSLQVESSKSIEYNTDAAGDMHGKLGLPVYCFT